MGEVVRRSYGTDVSDEEWEFVLPYLLLSRQDNRSRQHEVRELFNAVRYVVKTGNQWRLMPHDLPPWPAAYQQMQRWLRAGCFEKIVEDVQTLLRHFGGRKGQPTAVAIDSRTLQSTPESGARAGYDGAKRRKGSKVHIAVDTLGHLMALKVTPADTGDREQVSALAEQIQQVTGRTVELAYVDQGYTGENAATAAAQHGIRLEVVKHPKAKRGFVLLPRRWVVERSFAWAARFRRLARDYERLDTSRSPKDNRPTYRDQGSPFIGESCSFAFAHYAAFPFEVAAPSRPPTKTLDFAMRLKPASRTMMFLEAKDEGDERV